jgi:hypothetical protein
MPPPKIDEGVAILNNIFVAIMYWGKDHQQVSFVIVRKICDVTKYKIEKVGNRWQISWDGGEEWFEGHEDDPGPATLLDAQIQFLSILCFSCGDTKYLMMNQGRDAHCSCKCFRCRLTNNVHGGYSWLDHMETYSGELYTNQSFIKEIKEYQMVAAYKESQVMPEGFSEHTIHELISRSEENSRISGVTDKALLLPSIPMSRVMCPVLHIRLGLGNFLVSQIKLYIRKHIEQDLPDVADAKAKITDTELQIRRVRQLIADDDNNEEVVQARQMIRAYDKLTTNKTVNLAAYERLKAKANRTERDENLLLQFQAKVDYAPGTLTRVNANEMIAESDRLIEQCTATLNQFRETFVHQKNALNQLEAGNRGNRPVEKQFETILSKFGIEFTQHYTMTLVGEQIHRFCVHHEIILSELKAACIDAIRTYQSESNHPDGTEDEVTLFYAQMQELWETFDYICSIITRQEILSDEDIRTFPSVAKYFGIIWRLYGMSPTHKLHMLETHAADDLIKYKRLGIFDESPMESQHQDNNRFNRVTANIKRWDERIKYIDNLKNTKKMPTVMEQASQVEINTTRHFSSDVQAKKKAKKAQGSADKKERYDAVVEKALSFGLVVQPGMSDLAEHLREAGEEINEDGNIEVVDLVVIDMTLEF